MAWIIVIVAIMIISMFAGSTVGKVTIGAGVVAGAFLLIYVITGFEFLITFAKLCGVVVVVVATVGILISLIAH